MTRNSCPALVCKITFLMEMINPNTLPTWIMCSDYHCLVRVSLKDLRKSSNINGLQAASKAFILNDFIQFS